MRKILMVLLALLLLGLAASGLAEEAKVTFTTERGGKITVSADAEEIDLKNVTLNRQGSDYDNFIAFLRQLPNLKKVDMFSSEVYAKQVETLAANFPNIEFGWTMLIPCTNPLHPERTPHRVRTDQTAFSTLHNNQCTLHSTADLAILRFCKNLLALDLGHNAIDNLYFLYDMPQLKVLILGKNSLTDITPLGTLTQLEYLELFTNRVTDISPLANCENLVDLNICYNRISDFTPLTNCKKLRRLFVFNANNYTDSNPVPASVIGMLKSSLPGCLVDNITAAAIGAWRTHHRYDTIYEMFWGTEYIPFKNLD